MALAWLTVPSWWRTSGGEPMGEIQRRTRHHDPACEIRLTVRHVRQRIGQISPSPAFHGRQGRAALHETSAHGLRGRFLIVPPHVRSQLSHDGRFDRLYQRLGGGRIMRPRDHAQVDAVGFGIDPQIGVLLPEGGGQLGVDRGF